MDSETGSLWDPDQGLAVDGPLAGTTLKPVPYLSAFAHSWRDFYPDGTVYQEDR